MMEKADRYWIKMGSVSIKIEAMESFDKGNGKTRKEKSSKRKNKVIYDMIEKLTDGEINEKMNQNPQMTSLYLGKSIL